MTLPPRFFVFEGIDGSGKSTQCDLLFGHVMSEGLPAVRLAEPTDGEWGRRIRSMLKGNNMAPAEEQLELFLMDRKDDAGKNIIPALEAKKIVIMDRYYFSNAAYQGAAGIPPERVILENRRISVPEPDRVYLIDIFPEIALQRIAGRNGMKEFFERESFLKAVREIFLSIADKDKRFLIIDGMMQADTIFTIIKADFEALYDF
jgi:dTMP kinase